MRYEDGIAKPISESLTSNCYRTGCSLTLKVEGTTLSAHVETTTPIAISTDSAIKPVVDLVTEIIPNPFGGVGVQHTGTCGEGATMLHSLHVEWK